MMHRCGIVVLRNGRFLKKTLIMPPQRRFSSIPLSERLHVCIVGSGPAGIYTAEKMMKTHEKAEIDIIDRLPTPFGLVRSGVAPDHPETKIVINQFSRVASNKRCSFFGNVSLGDIISLYELWEIYDVVVLAYGAESDRNLSVPGESLPGINSAREFVWWYNGHPDYSNFSPELKNTDTAVILGQGNVALDVARILLKPTAELEKTDIADHALAALQESSIRKVYMVGRRGPVQAACTTKELREILRIKDLNIHIQEDDLRKSTIDEEELKNSRIQKRVYELFLKEAMSNHSHPIFGGRELHFVFFRRPVEFLPSDDGSGRVGRIRFEKTHLKGNGDTGKQLAVGTGQYEDINCGIVLKSIGYKSVPVEGLPFDVRRGIVPNKEGRVLTNNSEDSTLENGLYVVGWLKRGPTGIVATNLYCAEETVRSISSDISQGKIAGPSSRKSGRKGLIEILYQRKIESVCFKGWEKIDSKEKMLGCLKNKPRSKITTWDELLRTCKLDVNN